MASQRQFVSEVLKRMVSLSCAKSSSETCAVSQEVNTIFFFFFLALISKPVLERARSGYGAQTEKGNVVASIKCPASFPVKQPSLVSVLHHMLDLILNQT